LNDAVIRCENIKDFEKDVIKPCLQNNAAGAFIIWKSQEGELQLSFKTAKEVVTQKFDKKKDGYFMGHEGFPLASMFSAI
jgi:hypothetical protein